MPRLPGPYWFAVFAAAFCLRAAPAPAQIPERITGTEWTVAGLIAAGDARHASMQPREALDLFDQVLRVHPSEFDALWRAAREAVNLGMLADDGDQRKQWAERAVGYAERARDAHPDRTEGLEWLAIALGRLALEHGPKTKTEMAMTVYETAHAVLELDSLNAAAHHVLGEWNAEIRRLSGFERWAARKLLGADAFSEASWERAVYHLEKAAALSPDGLIHHLDLARTYLDVDRVDDARASLIEVLDRPAIEPTDALHKATAARLIGEL